MSGHSYMNRSFLLKREDTFYNSWHMWLEPGVVERVLLFRFDLNEVGAMFYSSVIEGIDGERMSFGLRLWLPEGNQHFWNIVCSSFNTFLFYALFASVFLN